MSGRGTSKKGGPFDRQAPRDIGSLLAQARLYCTGPHLVPGGHLDLTLWMEGAFGTISMSAVRLLVGRTCKGDMGREFVGSRGSMAGQGKGMSAQTCCSCYWPSPAC